MKLISVIVLVSAFGVMIALAEKGGAKKNKPTQAAHTHAHSHASNATHSDESREKVHPTRPKRDAKRIKPTRAPHGNHTKNASHEHGGHSKESHEHGGHSKESHERFRSTRPKRDAKKNKPTQAARTRHAHTHSHAAHSHESSEEVRSTRARTTVKA